MADNLVVVEIEIDPGVNKHSGGTAWAKAVNSIDPAIGTGYGLHGDFLPDSDPRSNASKRRFVGAFPEGAFIVMGAKRVGRKPVYGYVAGLAAQNYHMTCALPWGENDPNKQLKFSATGVKGLLSAPFQYGTTDMQEFLAEWPVLAPCVGKPMFPIFLAALADGGLKIGSPQIATTTHLRAFDLG